MGTPEMINRHYSLGDPGKREHIAQFNNVFDSQMAIASLKPNDPCFIRSGNWFTFAKVLSRKHGPEADIEFVVDVNHCTMTIPLRQCVRHVRTMKGLSAVQHHNDDSPPSFTDERSNEAVDIASRRGEWLQVKQHILHRSGSEQSRHLDRRSTGSRSSKPVRGGRRASLDDRTNPPHPQLSPSRPEAGARAGLDRPQRRLSVPSLKNTVRGVRRASGNRTAIPHPQLSLSRPEAEAPARLDRPQQRLSVPSLSKPFRVVRQASRDEQQASPVDVSQLSPSSSVLEIHSKCCPATRRSSLPISPLDDQSVTGLETSFHTNLGSTSPESHPERRVSHPPKTNFVRCGRRTSCVEQSRSYSPEPMIESRQTGPPSTPLRRYLEQRSPGLFSYKPVCGGRQVSPNEVASPRQSRLNRHASAVAAADLLNLILSMNSHSPTDVTTMHDDDAPSDISSSKMGDDDDAGIKINVDSSSGEKYPTASKSTNRHSSKPIRGGRRASLDDRTTSPHPQFSEAGGAARLVRPQRALSESLSNSVHRSRRASLDDYLVSPVDVSQFSPSSPESKIHTKICRPTTRRSSLPPLPFNHRAGTGLKTTPESHSKSRAKLLSHTEFVRIGMDRPAALIESTQTRPLQKPPQERRSSVVFSRRPVCGSRRISLDDRAPPPRSSLHRRVSAVTAAEDLVNLIASIHADRPKERIHVPIVTVTHGDDASSDISSSEGEDDDNSDNNAGMRVNVNSYLDEKFPTALKQKIDLPGLDTVGLNDQFWLEAWYALD